MTTSVTGADQRFNSDSQAQTFAQGRDRRKNSFVFEAYALQEAILRAGATLHVTADDLSRNTTYELLRRGEVPHLRFGRAIRIPKTALLMDAAQGRREVGSRRGGHA